MLTSLCIYAHYSMHTTLYTLPSIKPVTLIGLGLHSLEGRLKRAYLLSFGHDGSHEYSGQHTASA